MKKFTYTNNMPYSYEPDHKGAKYKIGETYKNHGEFLESVAKFHRGLDYLVNPNTSWDTGSDIESLNASVKTAGASLGRIYGNSYEDISKIYFENVHSSLWIFIQDFGDEIVEYHMNKEEFSEFLFLFHEMAIESGSHLTKVRLRKNQKMIQWLEERV